MLSVEKHPETTQSRKVQHVSEVRWALSHVEVVRVVRVHCVRLTQECFGLEACVWSVGFIIGTDLVAPCLKSFRLLLSSTHVYVGTMNA